MATKIQFFLQPNKGGKKHIFAVTKDEDIETTWEAEEYITGFDTGNPAIAGAGGHDKPTITKKSIIMQKMEELDIHNNYDLGVIQVTKVNEA